MRVIDWSSNVCSSDLGTGISVLRAGWRRPNDLDLCTLDMLAAADLAARAGATRFVTGGHSFGGAIAVRAGRAMGTWTPGVSAEEGPVGKEWCSPCGSRGVAVL